MYTHGRGLGTPTTSQHILTRKNSHLFSCVPDGVRTSGHRILSPMYYQLSHPVTPRERERERERENSFSPKCTDHNNKRSTRMGGGIHQVHHVTWTPVRKLYFECQVHCTRERRKHKRRCSANRRWVILQNCVPVL